MKKYRLRVGLDVDDILYSCNAYALELLNKEKGIEPPLTINDIHGWGNEGKVVDERIAYFGREDFVKNQPLQEGAVEFVRQLCRVADVFFVTAVPPACMSARALRLRADFPEVPEANILVGTRKDVVNLDILLDDGAHNIIHTPATYPVLFRKPWNTHLSGLLSVNTYDDFLHLVDMIRHAFSEDSPNLKSGGVVCLVGPTGSGKNQVAATLCSEYGMQKPLTATTRPRRVGEDENQYRFLTKEEFLAESAAGAFLETTVYSGYYFGTTAGEIDSIVEAGGIAVIPIDICGALSLKNRYREKALLTFMKRRKENVILEILRRPIADPDKARRIMSLADEARNEELCDVTVAADRHPAEVAAEIVACIQN